MIKAIIEHPVEVCNYKRNLSGFESTLSVPAISEEAELAKHKAINGVLKTQKLKEVESQFSTYEQEAKSFRKFIRIYNNKFAFTSLGIAYDKTLAQKTKGVYVFKIQGQVYHFINELIAHEGKASFLQLYFRDTEHEVENRSATLDKFVESIIVKLMEALQQNPYACFFQNLRRRTGTSGEVVGISASISEGIRSTPSKDLPNLDLQI
ncbi:hypothetical protein ACH5RR_023554 [Cinchona calisaya]|uniref:Uncharacterized protein n=1 Tax=Cinchona calisaya TaxID=153742 RepID=A0ABD2ZE48_9GENT